MSSNSHYAIMQNPANPCPPEVFCQLVAIPVRFVTFAGIPASGVIEVHRDLAADVKDLFRLMLAERFPLSSVAPIANFDWDDERSMAANNSCGFNYRMTTDGSKLSNHALGRAIDLNPRFNPYRFGNIVQPAGAVYDPSRRGTLTADSRITQFLKGRGFIWGGDWGDRKDYQHFEKL